MTDIRVLDLSGPICVDSAEGARLGHLVHEALVQGENVCLDFAGVKTLASAFLNTAVGSLYSFFSKDDLDQRFLWKNLDSTDEGVLRLVQRNAIRFHAATPTQREALLRSSTRVAEE